MKDKSKTKDARNAVFDITTSVRRNLESKVRRFNNTAKTLQFTRAVELLLTSLLVLFETK